MNAAAEFVFACHRCGLCCRAGHGRVWLADGDLPALAAACGEKPAAFAARHVVAVGTRLSLREAHDGCCTLLEDGNRCRAYQARPEQCRTFPYWTEILAGGAALDRAAGMCPGIQRIPERGLAERILPRVARLLRDAAPAATAPGERWLCSLEADFALAGGVLPEAPPEDSVRRALESLAAACGYPWSVGEARRLLAERAEGWRILRGGPPVLAVEE